MNLMALDYGSRRVGLAVSIKSIISPLKTLKNDRQLISSLKKEIDQYKIDKIYLGLSEGEFARLTLIFLKKLRKNIDLPIETVEESVSTIEADQIFKQNQNQKKGYKDKIDSIAAAVILRRVQV
ncbi:Holliday junction resolvase RuvX [Patescibacteria group bacterium]|nr:Holliday junction resolvase RuvX [Patescibacteria group bacterium]